MSAKHTRQTLLPVICHKRATEKPFTRVVNARVAHLRKLGYADLQDFLNADSDHIYVGRDLSQRVKGAVQSKWHNPFRLSDYNDDISVVIEKYKDYIRKSPLYKDIFELQGKTLACWCYPAPCHATALLELMEEKEQKRDQGIES